MNIARDPRELPRCTKNWISSPGNATTLRSENLDSIAPSDRLALKYADWLTPDVHGVSDADFRTVRAYFNDSQVVELTLTVCFFNYFTRMSEAFNLPVEPWVFDSPAKLQMRPADRPADRVGLISDAEMQATRDMRDALNNPNNPASSWKIGFANSMRAMLRSPEIATAWRDYGSSVRQSAAIDREIQLQVSFAVSMANGCRYCTLRQVLGLHRLGVSMSKLMAMKKDDDALTPRERTAVLFARKLTRDPVSVTDADYAILHTEFGDRGASDVVLQTCAFAFMNRFTDGLRQKMKLFVCTGKSMVQIGNRDRPRKNVASTSGNRSWSLTVNPESSPGQKSASRKLNLTASRIRRHRLQRVYPVLAADGFETNCQREGFSDYRARVPTSCAVE
jgi:AhpD family alkylhydroperoxidase